MLDFFIVTYLGHQWSRKLALSIGMLAAMMILFNMSYLVYYYGRISQPVVHLAVRNLNADAKRLDLSQLELFGHHQYRGQSSYMPLSQLNLILDSVMFSASEPSQSFASLSAQNQPSKVFRPGDEILPGIVLDKVRDDSVVISNNHRLELIKLPKANGRVGIMSVEMNHAN